MIAIRPLSLAFAASALLATPALAREDDRITIGAGVAYGPSYDGSDDYRVQPGGGARGKISGYNFYTRGLSLYVDTIVEPVGEKLDISFGPAIVGRRDRVSGIEDDQVRALGKLDTAIEIGAFAGISKTGVILGKRDTLSFRVRYLRDISGAHDSYVISPAIQYGTPLNSRTYIGMSLSTDYAGDGYARYYYSVTPEGAAASGLSAFDADGGFKNVSFGLLGARSLSRDLRKGWALVVYGNYQKMLGDFKRSPIVRDAGDSNQWFGAMGIAYTF